MKQVGIIAPIKSEPTSELTTKNSLLRAPKGARTRTPGTGIWMTPDKELSGKYRTGLDEDASYINAILNETDRNLEKKKVKELRIKLERALGVDLGPYSEFWNNGKRKNEYDTKHVGMIKLADEDNIFDLADPMQELNFTWLSVSRRIASSLEAYRRGEFPNAQFYVVNKEVENKLAFSRKKEVNKAVVLLDKMTPTEMKQVARLMGLPVTDDTAEEEVYKLIDDCLKQSEFRTGENKGLSTISVFTSLAKEDAGKREVKDLAKQLLTYNVIRRKDGGLYRGDAKVANNQEELIKILEDENQQEIRISLQEQLRAKKLILV